MSYIYFFILLVFLVSYSSFITFQLSKSIKLELFFRSFSLENIDLYEIDQFFNELKFLSSRKLWFTSIKLAESRMHIPIEYSHQYFNAVGCIYYRMKKYNLAKLYFLRSLSQKEDYMAALKNLAQVYKKRR